MLISTHEFFLILNYLTAPVSPFILHDLGIQDWVVKMLKALSFQPVRANNSRTQVLVSVSYTYRFVFLEFLEFLSGFNP